MIVRTSPMVVSVMVLICGTASIRILSPLIFMVIVMVRSPRSTLSVMTMSARTQRDERNKQRLAIIFVEAFGWFESLRVNSPSLAAIYRTN